MTSRDAHLKWIDSDDPKLMEWARLYLLKKGASIPAQSDKALIDWVNNHENNAGFREDLRFMRAAWRQKKHRDKSSGRKSYSFMLTTSAQANLKQISIMRKTSITAALEQLITDALDAEKRHKKELKTLEDEQKEQLAEIKKRIKETKELANGQMNEISEFAKAAKLLAAEASRLLRDLTELNLKNISTEAITDGDKAAIEESYLEELERLKIRLALPARLNAFSPRPYIHKPPKG